MAKEQWWGPTLCSFALMWQADRQSEAREMVWRIEGSMMLGLAPPTPTPTPTLARPPSRVKYLYSGEVNDKEG